MTVVKKKKKKKAKATKSVSEKTLNLKIIKPA